MIQGVFREEFGFEGLVMTDSNSSDAENVMEAIQAGNSLTLKSSTGEGLCSPKNGLVWLVIGLGTLAALLS
ncbi:hypothetical protein D3C74_119330 [compost metagenome]